MKIIKKYIHIALQHSSIISPINFWRSIWLLCIWIYFTWFIPICSSLVFLFFTQGQNTSLNIWFPIYRSLVTFSSFASFMIIKLTKPHASFPSQHAKADVSMPPSIPKHILLVCQPANLGSRPASIPDYMLLCSTSSTHVWTNASLLPAGIAFVAVPNSTVFLKNNNGKSVPLRVWHGGRGLPY